MPQYGPAGPCPICLCDDFQLARHETRDAYYLRCLNCGDHVLTGTAHAQVKNEMLTLEQRALRAHRVYRISPADMIGTDQLHAMATTGDLPEAAECLDNLVMFLAERQRPGESVSTFVRWLIAALGVMSPDAAAWVIGECASAGWVSGDQDAATAAGMRQVRLRLTAQGWEHHRQLMRSGAGSRHAFMAMDFKPADIQAFFKDHLITGVARTGFELRTTDHAQKTAGHIDARMRVELRTSRFVVCDLTHNNRGAYWEAGFAEGIGRPVFYLCRKDVHAHPDRDVRPHFDIAHQAIVKWDPADPGPAVEELVAMIRATLPGEARMED